MTEPVQIGDATLYLGDCLEILPTLGKVDAVIADPPYHGVLQNAWDNQWKSDAEFLNWVRAVTDLFVPILASNGSVYWFTSPQMSARVEVEIFKKFRILNNLVWDKSMGRKGAAGSGVDVGALRSFWTATTERIVFAEQYTGDSIAAGEAGYSAACEGAKISVFGSYLCQEFKRAGVTNREIAKLFPSRTGGLTGCVSNWLLGLNIPTRDQYVMMARHLNGFPPSDYLRKDYDDLRKDYDDLRKDYDDLRKDYDDLRRPFNLTAFGEWGDVWGFKIERDRVHEAQKPLAMIRHIVRTSSRPDDSILDPFMGSGTTGVACAKLGRKFIGIEIEPRYFDIACRRIEQAYAEPDLFIEPPKPAKQEAML